MIADILHTPPPQQDLLTVEQFNNACVYVDAVIAARQKAANQSE